MKSRLMLVSLLVVLISCVFRAELVAQERRGPGQDSPNLYLHAFGGAGISLMSAGDTRSALGFDQAVTGIGLPTLAFGLRGGFRHIAQVEVNFAWTQHNFNEFVNGQNISVRDMHYATTDVQVKINPRFQREPSRNEAGDITALFLVLGVGDVLWDGMPGTSYILGVDYMELGRTLSWGLSLKRYGIRFEQTETTASDYILELKFGLGIGN